MFLKTLTMGSLLFILTMPVLSQAKPLEPPVSRDAQVRLENFCALLGGIAFNAATNRDSGQLLSQALAYAEQAAAPDRDFYQIIRPAIIRAFQRTWETPALVQQSMEVECLTPHAKPKF